MGRRRERPPRRGSPTWEGHPLASRRADFAEGLGGGVRGNVSAHGGGAEGVEDDEAKHTGTDLLVAGHCGLQGGERQRVVKAHRQAVGGDDAVDTGDLGRGNEPEVAREPRGGAEADRDGLTVEISAVAGDLLDRVAEGVAEIEQGAVALFGLIARDNGGRFVQQ